MTRRKRGSASQRFDHLPTRDEWKKPKTASISDMKKVERWTKEVSLPDPRIRRDALLKRSLEILDLKVPTKPKPRRRVPLKTVAPSPPLLAPVKKAARVKRVQDTTKQVEPLRGQTCKQRPKRNKRRGSGGSRSYVPWC